MTEQNTTDQTQPETEEVTGEETPETERGTEDQTTEETTEEEPESFPRTYVLKLRDESAKHRQRAADRDDLAARLHTALVTATGRLADPTDLAYDDAHLTDPDALTAAVDELLTRKPHLASRRVVGDVGQGATGGDVAVDLASILRHRAT